MATLEDFLALIDQQTAQAPVRQRPEMDLRQMLLAAGPAMMAAGGQPGASFGGALGQGLMHGQAVAARQMEQDEKRQLLGQQQQMERLKLGASLFEASKKEQKPLTFVDVRDPTTGKMTKVGLNQLTGQQVTSVGEVSDPNDPKAPPGFRLNPDGSLMADAEWERVQTKLRAAGASKTNVSVDQRQESEFAKQLGKEQADQFAAMTKGGRNALANNTKLELMGRLVDTVETGRFAESKAEIQKALDGIGIKVNVLGKPDQVAAVETINQLSNALTLGKIGGEGGMPAQNFSNTDRTFLTETVPKIGDSPAGVRMKIEVEKRNNRRAVQVARMAERWVNDKKTMNGFMEHLDAWTEKNPLFGDLAAQSAPAAARERVAAPSTLQVTTPTRDGMGTQRSTAPVVDRTGGKKAISQMQPEELKGLDLSDPAVAREVDARLKALGF